MFLNMWGEQNLLSAKFLPNQSSYLLMLLCIVKIRSNSCTFISVYVLIRVSQILVVEVKRNKSLSKDRGCFRIFQTADKTRVEDGESFCFENDNMEIDNSVSGQNDFLFPLQSLLKAH